MIVQDEIDVRLPRMSESRSRRHRSLGAVIALRVWGVYYLALPGNAPRVEPSFTTRAESSDDSVVVHVDGDIDVATSDRLRAHMSQLVDSGPNLVLDLNEVSFMDTIGISALLRRGPR